MKTGLLYALLASVAMACAADLSGRLEQVELLPLGASQDVLVLSAPLKLTPRIGSRARLPEGSAWKPVGRLDQGVVYKPDGRVLQIEARHVHEAYLVVRDKEAVGFYLPAEAGFLAVKKELEVPTR